MPLTPVEIGGIIACIVLFLLWLGYKDERKLAVSLALILVGLTIMVAAILLFDPQIPGKIASWPTVEHIGMWAGAITAFCGILGLFSRIFDWLLEK
jgi:hypothetical protein